MNEYQFTEEPMHTKRWDRKRDRHVTRKTNKRNKPFIAWDSEGYTDESGEHHMMLFGCSTGDYLVGESIKGTEAIRFLLKTATEHDGIHVIFSGGYDVVMMLRHYPQAKIERILKGEVTWWNGIRHEYFKSKWFRVSDGHNSVTLYDVFTFFSTSFVKACREYLGENSDFDRIEQTKLLRDSFTLDDVETLVIPYWKQELSYLVELCTILRQRLRDAGIEPSQWHGPGAVASAVLKDKGIKAHMAKCPEEVREASRYAYFGGRFEQFQIGYRKGPIYQYDIRSAYPYAITRLPSLASIRWINRQKRKGQFDPYGIYKVSYHANRSRDLSKPGPLPWRSKNRNIYYPHDIGLGWYWGIELISAQKHKTGEITVIDCWEPATLPINYPFEFVQNMYTDRAQMKRDGNPTQLALKLAMNSLYGKLAQSKGAKYDEATETWRIPAFHQLEWAGWITAATRAKLYDAMMLAGNSLIAVETDAVYTTKKLDLPVSDKLGDWEYEELDAILYIQSGVYFKKDKGSWLLKSRGFEPRNHTYEAWISIMEELPANSSASVSITVRRFGSVPTSKNFAKWYQMSRTSQILQKSSKRIHIEALCDWCKLNTKMSEELHTLIVPQFGLTCEWEQSYPHALPWIDPENMPSYNDSDGFMITEEEFMELGWL